ncbi:hypothetical protein NHQ30_001929 [Ciborinia camelliae]|nr:hypothetical protein NHQ30_001929 [Ciborinia camelliae]
MARYALALSALLAIAQAITITSPSTDGKWDLSTGAQTITWTSVNTDASVVDIYLVHMASNPPLSDRLFSNVDISKGSESVTGLQLPTGTDYQINFVSPGKPEQILAQSQQFTVEGVVASASSTLAGYTGASATPSSASSTSASSSSSSASSSSSESSTATSELTSSSGAASTVTSTFTSTGSGTTVTGTATSTLSSSATGTGLTTATSGNKTSTSTAKASSTASGNGAAATGIPMMGLLAGAAALFL